MRGPPAPIDSKTNIEPRCRDSIENTGEDKKTPFFNILALSLLCDILYVFVLVIHDLQEIRVAHAGLNHIVQRSCIAVAPGSQFTGKTKRTGHGGR